MRPQDRYTYENAGFNSFMLRSLKSNPGAQTVSGGISVGTGKPLAFDRMQIAGALGDQLSLGRIVLDGTSGKISILDETKSFPVGWIGDFNTG